VPYRGAGQALNAVYTGEIQVYIGDLGLLLPHVREGTLRALAVASPVRSAVLPEVPTMAQAGVAGVQVASWNALAAPAGTPPAVLAQLNQAVRQVVDSQGFRDYALTQVQFAESSTPEGLADYMARDVEAWRRVIEPLDLKVD
jgi:tripartite-type tricarboxylate transporter receptor subunit TctC